MTELATAPALQIMAGSVLRQHGNCSVGIQLQSATRSGLLGEDLSVDSSSQGGYIIYVESLLDGSPAQRSGRYMPGASSHALNALTAPAWVRVPDQIMHDWLISDSPFVSITNLFECVWMQDP